MSTPAEIRAVAERRFAEHRDKEVYSPLGNMMLDTLNNGYAAMEKVSNKRLNLLGRTALYSRELNQKFNFLILSLS